MMKTSVEKVIGTKDRVHTASQFKRKGKSTMVSNPVDFHRNLTDPC